MSAKKPEPQPFGVRVAAVTVDPPGATFGPRVVEGTHEFIWIIDGEAKVRFGSQTFRASAGTVLLRRPGVGDYYEWSKDRATVHAYIHFSLSPAQSAGIDWSGTPPFRVPPPNDILRPLVGYIVGLGALPEPVRDGLARPALELLLKAYLSGQLLLAATPSVQVPLPVEKALALIRMHAGKEPSQPLRLKDLAAAAFTSPGNLCRLFKQAFDLSPLEYAKLVRLDRAAHHLRGSSRPLKSIAMSTGFYDAYHLSRSFTQVYGLSPKLFRNSDISAWLRQRNPITRVLHHRSYSDPPGADQG